MKKTTLTLFALVALACATYGQAKVYVLRSTGKIASRGKFNFYIDQKKSCAIANKTFSIMEVQSGKHEFASTFNDKEKIDQKIFIDFENSKSYYIQISMPDFTKAKLLCIEVTEGTAKELLKDLKQVDCNN